jgi:flagellar hook-associated protein 1 FlgK
MSLSQALGTAVAGLRTTQAGLALISGNVANAETPGYVKRSLNQTTISTGATGSSVRVEGVTRQLDQYIQRQLRTETSGGAYADLRSQFYSRLQQVYGDPGSATALETIYSNFTDALQSLSVSPDDFSARTAVINSAQVLAQHLNNLTADIQGLRSDAEQGLADAVRTANTAMTRIAEINQQIAGTNSIDGATATLIDQRDQYISQLSELMDIRVTTDDANRVMVYTGAGTQLVGTQPAHLDFDAFGTVTAASFWNADPTKRGVGTLTLSTATGGTTDLITNKAIRSGQIAAYLEMRDQVLVQAQSQLDQLASAMSLALSDHTTAGTPVTSGAQTGFSVDIGALASGNTVQLAYTDTTTNAQRTFTLVRVDDPTALPLPNSTTADPNDQVIGLDWTGGIASVVNQLNAKFFGKLTFSNPSGTNLQVLDNGGNTTRMDAFSATATAQTLTGGVPELPLFRDGVAAYTGEIDGSGRQITGFAGRITVNAQLAADPSRLVIYNTSPVTPSGDPTRPNFLRDRMTSASLMFSPEAGIGTATAPFSGSLPSFLRQVISQQGSAAEAAKNLSDGQALVVDALKQRFNDASAVSVDTEMSNLLVLQTAYGANARVVQAVKEMFDTLMNI